MVSNYKKGVVSESLARAFLRLKGFNILHTNWRCPFGELDIVASKDSALFFVEVKYRSSVACGFPHEAVSRDKLRKLNLTRRHYLNAFGLSPQTPQRFVIISIYTEAFSLRLDMYPSKFTYS